MPTVEELEIAYSDQISAGANAGTDSLNKMADAMDRTGASADTVDTKVTRTSKSAAGWVNSLDNVTKSGNALQRAQQQLAQVQDTVNKGVADGSVTQDAAARAIQTQQDKIVALTQRHADFVVASKKSSDATKDLSTTLDDASPKLEAHSGLIGGIASAFGVSTYQIRATEDELHKFIDQVLAGGSPLKALEFQLPNISQNLNGLGNVARVVGGFLMGPGGLVVAAAAAGVALFELGAHAESQQEELATLSQQLRATRTDYDAVAASAQSAARYISQTQGISGSDATATVKVFDAAPTIDGTNSTEIAALTAEAHALSIELGTNVPAGAAAMTAAMADPEKAAQDFATKGLLGVHEQLALNVKAMQDSGDAAGAYTLLNNQLQAATAGAVDKGLTPFGQALRDLHQAFAGPLDDAKSFGKSIGDYVVEGATIAIERITAVVNALKQLPGNWNGNDLSVQPATSAATPLKDVIAQVGQSINAQQDVVSLAQRLQPLESSTGQFDKNGAVVQSSAGALGAMQVMPGNANGNDLSTTIGNVTAAEQLLIDYFKKYNGNQILVSMAYNWGPGNVDKYLAGQASVPHDVAVYAQEATGGHAYTATTVAAKQQGIDAGLSQTDTSTAGQVTTQTEAIKNLNVQMQNLKDLHDAGNVSDADYGSGVTKLTALLNDHQRILLNLRDPMQQLAHAQDLATQSAGAWTGQQKAMVQADQAAEQAAREMGYAHANSAQILDAERGKQQELTNSFNVGVAATQASTAAQNALLQGYDGTTGTLNDYIIAEQAAIKVRETSAPGTAEEARQIAVLTSSNEAAANSATNLATAQGLLKKNQDLDAINLQTSLLGTNSDDAARAMAALAEQQSLVQRYGSAAAVAASDQAQQEAGLAARTEDATLSLNHQKQTLADLSSSASGVFDTLGNDITQAFTQGSGAAVTFTSIMQGLETQLASLIIKFAVINPLLNSLLGTNSTTISDIGSLLGSSSLSGGGSSSGLSLGTMGSLAGVANSASSGGILNSLGLGGVGSSVSGFLGTNLWGGTSAASAIGTSGDINAAYTSTAGLGGTSIGSLLGGAGLGFGAGSLLNGLVGGNKLGGTAGSGVGGLAGAAIGSIIPGVGTLIGGLLGGAGGGLLGGLFGGHAKNPYTLDTVSTAGGQLSLGSSYNQAENDATTAQLKADIASLNSTFATLGATVSSVTGKTNLGPIGDGAGNAVSSIAGRLGALRLTGSTATETQAYSSGLSTADDASVSAFQTAVTALKSMADTVDTLGVKVKAFNADAATVTVGGAGSFSGYSAATTSALDHALDGKTISTSDLQTQISTIQTFVDTTMPGLLTATTSGASDYQTQLAGLTSTYTAAEAQASALGISTDGLASKLSDLSAQMLQTQEETLRQQTDALKVRDYTATGNTEAAAMLTAADNNSTETTAFNQSWQDIYGSAYATAAGYAQALQLLQQTQGDEMIALQKQYDAQQLQLTQAAHSAMAGAVENAYTAQATLADDGTPGGKVASLTYAENGALYAFDDQRQATLDVFSKSLTDAYGQSITTTAGYAAEMAQEETTLGLQRLAIVKSYSDQIAAVTSASYAQAQQSATSLLGSLSDYVTSLATSNLSPLSAADQYKAANDDYRTDLAKAQAGNFTAMQALQGDANTLLTSSQTYNGSGTAFDSDYTRVLQDIQSIAAKGSDALTASALNAALAPVTDTLAGNQQTLIALTKSLLTEMQQANMRKGKAA